MKRALEINWDLYLVPDTFPATTIEAFIDLLTRCTRLKQSSVGKFYTSDVPTTLKLLFLQDEQVCEKPSCLEEEAAQCTPSKL